MTGQGESRRRDRERREATGRSLAHAYPPDKAADEVLDGLIHELGQVPWPRSNQTSQ